MISAEASRESFDALNAQFVQFIRTDPLQAREYILQAYKVARELNTLSELSQAWYGMGVMHLILGQSQQAVPYFRKAVKALGELGDEAKKIRARGNLANALNDIGQIPKAEKQYRILLREFERIGDRLSMAKTHYNLGNLEMRTHRFGEALRSYKAAEEIYKSESDPLEEANVLCMMGSAYARLFDYEKNLQCCQRALDLVEKEDNPYYKGIVYNALGNAYLFIKQYDLAIDFYRRGLEIGRAFGIHQHIASNLTNLAETLTTQNKLEEALGYALEALKLDRKTDLLNYLAMDHYVIGRIYQHMGRFDESIRQVNKAMRISENAGLREVWIGSAILQIHNYARTCAALKGRKLFSKLEREVENQEESELYLHFLESGALLFSALGDFARSNDFFSCYHDLTKERIISESQRRAQDLHMVWETERREKEKRWLAKQNKLLEKRVQEELDNIREKDRLLAEQENMALLGRITAGIAHELNNPLAAIKQAVEITLAAIAKEKSGDLYLSAKQQDIYRMLQRINRLVEIIKVISHSPDRFSIRPFRINDMVAEFTDLFSDRILKGSVNLVTELNDGLPELEGDAIRFIQVISILVSNANDAMSKSRAKLKKVVIRTYQKEDKVILEVADNGPGMSDELLAKARLPFFSTKDVDKGMGMGLSIASAIVGNMSGDLLIQSKPGKGTTVKVVLPIP